MKYTVLLSVIGYLIGSINFAVIFSRLIYKEDIRCFGSGNPGASNTVRVYGKKAGAAVFLCDFSKGLIAVAIAKCAVAFLEVPQEAMLAAGIFAQVGHIFPVYHGFRGGKGVATAAGAAFAVMPIVTLILLAAFAVIFVSTRIVSVASGVCAALYPVLAYFMGGSNSAENCIFAMCCSMLILIKHISNFSRLINGTEPKYKN